jgi:hypothetical protein
VPFPPEDHEGSALRKRRITFLIERGPNADMGRANPLVQSRPRLFDPHKYISLICQGRAGVSLHERHRDLVAVEPPREKVATILGVEPVFRAGVRGKGGDQPRDAQVALSHRRHLLRGFLLLLRRALSTHNVPALAKSYLRLLGQGFRVHDLHSMDLRSRV